MNKSHLTETTTIVSLPEVVAGIVSAGRFAVADIGAYANIQSKQFGEDVTVFQALIRNLLTYQNGKDYLAIHKLLSSFFSNRAIAAWADTIDQEIEYCLDHLGALSRADLVKDLADVVFARVISKVIGLKMEPLNNVLKLVLEAQKLTEPILSLHDTPTINAVLSQLKDFISTNSGAHGEPRSLLETLRKDVPNLPTDKSIEIMVIILAITSHRTAQTLSFVLWGMLTREAAFWSKAAEPGWAETQLEHALSLYPSPLALYRATATDADISSSPENRGQPTLLDVRESNNQLPMSQLSCAADGILPPPIKSTSLVPGAHSCLGEPLSRLLIGRAIPAMAKRFPRVYLDKEMARFSKTDVGQILVSLPCHVDAKSRMTGKKIGEIKDHGLARIIVTDDLAFGPPDLTAHLDALGRSSGKDLSRATLIARNAMFFMSGPRHATARKAVTDCLGANRLTIWEPKIEQAIELALERLATAKAPDLVGDFTEPLFRMVSQPMMGIAPSDPARFDAIAPAVQEILKPLLPLRELLRIQDIFVELLQMIEAQPDDAYPKEPKPVLNSLREASLAEFSDADCAALVLVLYGASFNLSHTLANALHWCLSLPKEERDGIENNHWIAQHLEQIISLCASPKYIYRVARHAKDIGEMSFAANDTAQIHLAPVNYGMSAGNLAFGHGLHHCVGASLSRLVLKMAIPPLFRRFPQIHLEPQDHSYFEYSQTVALQSLKCRL